MVLPRRSIAIYTDTKKVEAQPANHSENFFEKLKKAIIFLTMVYKFCFHFIYTEFRLKYNHFKLKKLTILNAAKECEGK
jgi:hypothetical protein